MLLCLFKKRYHHATVLIYCWYSTHSSSSSGRWFIAMNFFVHALMYTYYTCRSMRITIPKFVSVIITILQISQMFVGICVNCVAYWRKLRGLPCDVSYDNIYWSFIMYFSYFMLFFHFFANVYLKKNGKRSIRTAASNNHTSSSHVSEYSNGVNNHHAKKHE